MGAGLNQSQNQQKSIDIVFDGIANGRKNYDVAKSAGVSLKEYGRLRNEIFHILSPLVSNSGGFSNFVRNLKVMQAGKEYADQLATDIGDKEEEVEKLSSAITDKENQIEKLNKERSGVLDSLKSTKEEERKINSKTEFFRKHLSQYDMTIDDYLGLDCNVESLKSEWEGLKPKVEDRRGKVESLEWQIEELKGKKKNLEKELSKSRADYNFYLRALPSKRQEYNNLSWSIKAFRSELSHRDELIKDVDSLEEKKADLEKYQNMGFDEIEKRIKEYAEKKRSEIEEEVKEYREKKFSDVDKEVEEREAVVSNLDEKIKSLEEECGEKKRERDGITSQIEYSKRKYSEITEKVKGKTERLNMLLARPESSNERLLAFYRSLLTLNNEDIQIILKSIDKMGREARDKLWMIASGLTLRYGTGLFQLAKNWLTRP